MRLIPSPLYVTIGVFDFIGISNAVMYFTYIFRLLRIPCTFPLSIFFFANTRTSSALSAYPRVNLLKTLSLKSGFSNMSLLLLLDVVPLLDWCLTFNPSMWWIRAAPLARRTALLLLPQQAWLHACCPSKTYANVCWRMLTYANVCWRMLTYAAACWLLACCRSKLAAMTYDVGWRMCPHTQCFVPFPSKLAALAGERHIGPCLPVSLGGYSRP